MRGSSDEVARRFQAALDMYDDGVALVRARLVRESPAATVEQIDALLRDWLLSRPGAEHGDGVGRPRPVAGRAE